MPQQHTIDGVELILATEDSVELNWIGNRAVQEQLMAAWLVLQAGDLPLNPRIVGKPGVGKTTLAYTMAKRLKKPAWIVQCTMDTRPEDLIVTPVMTASGRIAYHASGLVTAMIRGGVCILDEANRMSEKSWASLAPLLDARRYVESIVAGIKIAAHPDFRVCATMNEDTSTYDVPEYIHSRLKPIIEVGFPTKAEEREILKFSVPFAQEDLLQYVTDFLQRAHAQGMPFTSRDGIHIVRYAMKMASVRGGAPAGFLLDAIEAILGEPGVTFIDSGRGSSGMRGAVRSESVDEDDEALESDLPDDEFPDDEETGDR